MLLFLLTACGDTLTTTEAKEAVSRSVSSAKAEALTTEVVEITTEFTLGEAVEEAAENLRSFLESQIPCSTVTRDGAEVTLDFGTLDDACTWNGETYAGVVSVSVVSVDGTLEVHHTWEGLTNGELTLDGEATVTWDPGARTRNVQHTLTWTDADGAWEASGDRTQSLLDESAGLAGGIVVDGSRSWTDGEATWDLDIAGIELRAQDPCPQAGVYTVTTPAGKTATLSFERLDEDTIQVTLEGTRRPYVVEVTSAG